ncbi:MAG: hypothetical protein HY794_13370 [Desulfarculus sp.]|nr:hypothetical protein [Desulfarculus sp.]
MASLSYRNNNPGNIRDGAFARSCPGYAGCGEKGFAKFTDWGFGVGALARLLRSSSYRDLSIHEIIARYAPASENDTGAYVQRVCQRAGVRPEDKISGPVVLCEVMAAMIVHEGWKP